jgi:hypothetical protein
MTAAESEQLAITAAHANKRVLEKWFKLAPDLYVQISIIASATPA